jgi:hypothetical protein
MAAYTSLGLNKNTRGMQFTNLRDSGNGMGAVWGIFAVEWALFLVLGWYLEQVLDNGTGVRRRPLFFLEWVWAKVGGRVVPSSLVMMLSACCYMCGSSDCASRVTQNTRQCSHPKHDPSWLL